MARGTWTPRPWGSSAQQRGPRARGVAPKSNQMKTETLADRIPAQQVSPPRLRGSSVLGEGLGECGRVAPAPAGIVQT